MTHVLFADFHVCLGAYYFPLNDVPNEPKTTQSPYKLTFGSVCGTQFGLRLCPKKVQDKQSFKFLLE